jgi:hypothetical protein
LEHRVEGANLIVTLPAGLPDVHAYALRVSPRT